MMGSLTSRDALGSSATNSTTYFLLSPQGERYKLTLSLPPTTRLLAWSSDGRYVVTLDVDALTSNVPQALAVRDLRTWNVVSRRDFSHIATSGSELPEPYVDSAAFFGSGRGSLVVTYTNVDPVNGSDVYVPQTYTTQLFDTTHSVARPVGSTIKSWMSAEPQPDGGAVAIGGLTIARMSDGRWISTSLGNESCTFVKWWSPDALLAACELRGDEGHTQLFAYDVHGGSRTAVSPIPGSLFSDADRGQRSFAWAYDDAFDVKGRVFVHGVPTCGPGWVETVRDGMGHILRGTGGGILGASRDALILDVVRGECMGGWAVVRLDAATLRRHTLLTSREWAGRDVAWVQILQRYGKVD
jgi:hypothetical protein